MTTTTDARKLTRHNSRGGEISTRNVTVEYARCDSGPVLNCREPLLLTRRSYHHDDGTDFDSLVYRNWQYPSDIPHHLVLSSIEEPRARLLDTKRDSCLEERITRT